MKKVLPVAAIILLLLSGVALLIYPTVSDWLEERHHSEVIQIYNENITAMDVQAREEEFRKAKEYNDALTGAEIKDPFIPGSGAVLPENYTSILNIDGIIGYIEIPIIDVSLPIYHGTSEAVLRKGVGHMDMTAFPIGGKGYHCVVTGHTGLSSAKLFTDLNKLVIGNVFYIKVLDQTLAYETDQILVVAPDDTSALLPVSGEDYVTLVTCTPYAINSHRLLVRGTRIPYQEEAAEQPEEAVKMPVNWRIVMIISFAALMAVAYVTYRIIDRRKRRRDQ